MHRKELTLSRTDSGISHMRHLDTYLDSCVVQKKSPEAWKGSIGTCKIIDQQDIKIKSKRKLSECQRKNQQSKGKKLDVKIIETY